MSADVPGALIGAATVPAGLEYRPAVTGLDGATRHGGAPDVAGRPGERVAGQGPRRRRRRHRHRTGDGVRWRPCRPSPSASPCTCHRPRRYGSASARFRTSLPSPKVHTYPAMVPSGSVGPGRRPARPSARSIGRRADHRDRVLIHRRWRNAEARTVNRSRSGRKLLPHARGVHVEPGRPADCSAAVRRSRSRSTRSLGPADRSRPWPAGSSGEVPSVSSRRRSGRPGVAVSPETFALATVISAPLTYSADAQGQEHRSTCSAPWPGSWSCRSPERAGRRRFLTRMRPGPWTESAVTRTSAPETPVRVPPRPAPAGTVIRPSGPVDAVVRSGTR